MRLSSTLRSRALGRASLGSTPSLAFALVCAVGVSALGCASKPTIRAEASSSTTPAPQDVPNLDAVAVSGLHGTLSQEEIRGALEPRLPKFLRCAAARLGELEVLSGSLTFSFHIAVNGSVAAVSPSQSSLGDRATERCMLEVAQNTHFPEPHGGEADFTWPLELPLDSDVRAPSALSADFAQPVTSARVRGVEQADGVHGTCGGGEYVVTSYVDPDGHVLAAGVATPDSVTSPELDCVAAAVMGWTFPSPGSYVGKLSFTVP